MNFLDKLVGKKQALTTSDAIQKLHEMEFMLFKKQEYLESKIEKEKVSLVKNASKNKSAALQSLRRKKRYEKQLQQIDNTLTTIEMQREALELATTNTTLLKTMQNAATALKKTQVNVNVEEVNNIMDSIADQQELVNEIANAIGNPVGFDDDIDEDELELELEALEERALEEKLLEIPVLPKAPTGKIGKAKKSKDDDDDDDLERLVQWAL
ncbi:charged multivesicular body protein 4b-like [Zophobas morio]|uniref:charged multivesicular body protein 4b-like n=1 Tax=Zophobas morio TaxID=2755281 RepID=UPI00308395C5